MSQNRLSRNPDFRPGGAGRRRSIHRLGPKFTQRPGGRSGPVERIAVLGDLVDAIDRIYEAGLEDDPRVIAAIEATERELKSMNPGD